MRGQGNADQRDGGPHAVKLRRKEYRYRAGGTDEQRDLAGGEYVYAALDQGRGNPAADDRANIGEQIDQYQRQSHSEQRHMELRVEKARYPVVVEPPCWIGEHAAGDVDPCTGIGQQLTPGNLLDRDFWILVDVGEFAGHDSRMLGRVAIAHQPEHDPDG